MLARIILTTHWPEAVSGTAPERVFVPALHRFPPALREIAGLLPVTDINGGLLEALAARGKLNGSQRIVAGIFAADPFLDPVELAERLAASGVSRVANFPTVQHFDGATAEGLTAVGYDLNAELSVLRRLAAAGQDVLAYVATPRAAETALDAGIATLVYHPGLPPLPSGARASLTKIEQLASEAGARLLVHVTAGDDGNASSGVDQPINP